MSASRATRQRDDAGVGAARGGGGDGLQRGQPFLAFLVFDGFAGAVFAFTELGGIARPGRDVEHAERQAAEGEGLRGAHCDPPWDPL